MAERLDTATSATASPYWEQTRRPWVSLLFLLPALIAYEAGVLWHASQSGLAIRNGADHWLRSNLQSVNDSLAVLLPGFVVLVLLGWHVRRRDGWRISGETFVGMAAESLLFALCLLLIGQLNETLFRISAGQTLSTTVLLEPLPVSVRIVSFLGAGVYEEFVFRLCLIPPVVAIGRALMFSPKASLMAAIIATSLIFSLAHHLVPLSDAFTMERLQAVAHEISTVPHAAQSFVFRTAAGVYFAVLFLSRGFGVAVGAHALYDITVGVLLADA